MFALLGAAVGFYRYLTATPIYEARLTMIVEPERANTTADSPVLSWYVFSRFYETQYQVIKSRVVAERVVDRLELIKQPAETVDDAIVQPSFFARIIATVSSFITDTAGDKNKQTGPRESEPFDRRSQLAESIKNGLDVRGGDNSQLVELALRSADAQYAADVVNTVAQEYIALGIENRAQKTRSAGQWLTEQIEELRQKVVDSEAALKGYQAKEGIVNLESLNELTNSQLITLNEAVVNAQERYNELAKRYGSKHPRLIAAGGEVAEARARLKAVSQSSVATQEKRFELAKLEQEVNTNRELYESYLTRLNEADFSTDENLANAYVLDLARVPEIPVAPDKRKLLTTWTLLGIVLGLVMIAIREHLDLTFKTHREVESILDMPALGVLPLLQGGLGGARRKIRSVRDDDVVPERHYATGTGSPFAESVNHIRTGILYSDVDHPPKTIVITSSIQHEGKTTLAINLALAFAQLGKTLILDADLRKPRASLMAGSNKTLGLVDYVAVRCDLQDCIIEDETSNNLSILRSGLIPPNPLELLSSKRFARALEGLKGKFTYIVIDAPPVLPVSDAIVLGRLADATIMVVEAHHTTQATAIEAVERMRASNVVPLGAVLTKLNQRKQGYYYYGQYNDYGSYYKDEKQLLTVRKTA